MKLAYLYARYPIVSQTFCDTEMIAIEKSGRGLKVYSIHPPPTSFRHGHTRKLNAEIVYGPPPPVTKLLMERTKREGTWPEKLVRQQQERYGAQINPELRARNALYFAEIFRRDGVQHVHVHFFGTAAHTALFVKHLTGITFSITGHGQDFMVDLGSQELLRDLCCEAQFVAAETDFSKNLLAKLCSHSAQKMVRTYNGVDLTNFPADVGRPHNVIPSIISVGRLIEFKGFHHLIRACAYLRDWGIQSRCEIIGEGPWRERLERLIAQLGLENEIELAGTLPQEEVFARLRRADIFVLPCIVDTKGASDVFPTVLLEAMAAGCACVSTNLAGVPEMIEHGESGLLVAAGNDTALADALARLAENGEQRAQFGRVGRERLVSEFSIDKTVQPLLARFEKILRDTNETSVQSPLTSAILLSEWPPQRYLAPLYKKALKENAHTIACRLGEVPENDVALLSEFGNVTLLPDAMVVEGEWLQNRHFADRAERCRVDLGQKLSSDVFLQQARFAVYLRGLLARRGIRELHAVGSEALLCAWILKHIADITARVSLAKKEPMPNSILSRLDVSVSHIGSAA